MDETQQTIEYRLKMIRNRNLPTELFKWHSLILADWLLLRALEKIPSDKRNDVIPIVIFRASLVFMPAILQRISRSSIGFLGLRRNEETAVADLYYINLPKINKNSRIIILDPMLGTCGTLIRTYQEVAKKLKEDSRCSMNPYNVSYVGFLAAESGLNKALDYIPVANITLLAVDPELDANNFISPGLGDFGDRFCGN